MSDDKPRYTFYGDYVPTPADGLPDWEPARKARAKRRRRQREAWRAANGIARPPDPPPPPPRPPPVQMRENLSPISKWFRRITAIIDRDGILCWLCGEVVHLGHRGAMGASIDHFRPKSLGGLGRLENLRLAHSVCNHRRGNAMVSPAPAWAKEQELRKAGLQK